MYGALYVVEDLDEYQADPEAYLAAHPLPIKDDLLKITGRARSGSSTTGRRRSPSWRTAARSPTASRCFRWPTASPATSWTASATQFGPDLTKLDPKLQPLDILKDILEPSAKINEKFQTYIFELDVGQGRHRPGPRGDAGSVKVIENPLAKARADR